MPSDIENRPRSRTWFAAAMAIAAAAAVFTACGGDDDDGGQASLPEEAYCQLLHRACERQIECGAPVLNTESTVADCDAAAACEEVLPDVLAAGATLRAPDIAACGVALDDAACPVLVNERFPEFDTACATLIEGAGEEGDACTGGVVPDCRAGLVCDTSDTCPGACRAADSLTCTEGSCAAGTFCDFGRCEALAAGGEACEFGSVAFPWERTCADGFFCGEGGTCVPSIPAGEACPDFTPYACEDGLACVEGTCADPHATGEPCGTYTDCAAGLTCDFASGTCAARGGEGDRCDAAVASCAAGLTCHHAGSSDEGTCQVGPDPAADPEPRPVASPGDDCAHPQGPDLGAAGDVICPLGTACLCDDERCSRATCAPAPRLGEDCTAAAEANLDLHICAEGLCDILDTFTCVQPGPAGAPCHGDDATLTLECLSLVCERGACVSYEDATCDQEGELR